MSDPVTLGFGALATLLVAFLASRVGAAEAALMRNLRTTPEHEEAPELRNARAFPRAALTSLWLLRDGTLLFAATLGILSPPHAPALAAGLVLVAFLSAHIAARRSQAAGHPLRGRIWKVVDTLLPMSRALRVLGQDVARRGSGHAIGDEEAQVARADQLDPDERELLANVRTFGSRDVRDVMTPRVDLFTLPVEIGVEELVHEVDEARFARIPVRRNDEEIAGILYVKDLLGRKLEADFDLASILHPVEIIEPDTAVDVAFRSLRERRTHIALVYDDLGSLVGLVTMEDLLEELFGEIRDEGDSGEVPDYVRQGEDLVVSGRLPVRELAEVLGRKLSAEDDRTTVGGMLMTAAGRIPRVAEAVTIDGLRFTVERREGTVLRRVRVEQEEEAA